MHRRAVDNGEPASGRKVTRRALLGTVGAVAVGAGTAGGAVSAGRDGAGTAPATARPRTRTPAGPGAAAGVPGTAGTTLDTAATASSGSGYRGLAPGRGWPLVVRGDLARPRGGRDDRRTVLACFAQFTDLHVTDVQSPARYEFLSAAAPGAWRPQEALTAVGAVGLVERINALRTGPHTGAPIAFVMTTGDNTDNQQANELDWYLAALSGGRFTPDSGDPGHYEGVQNSGLPQYWDPSRPEGTSGFPGAPFVPRFLDAARRPVTSPGLLVPWYATVGNHDNCRGGCATSRLRANGTLFTGARKLESVSAADARRLLRAATPGEWAEAYRWLLTAYAKRMRTVTADPRRRPFTPEEYLAAHLDPARAGAGPAGHGYASPGVGPGRMYYTFPIADGVLGVSLDTTNPSGLPDGSLGTSQLRWLEGVLTAHSSRWYDTDGRPVRRPGTADAHVVLFSHHSGTTMDNLLADPSCGGERRHSGKELIALLHRFPNVVAWVNGHTHRNALTPHRSRLGPAGDFWEVNTASHVDHPQLARLVELVDNHDGTLSLLTTLVESAAPYRTDPGDLSQRGLAAYYRELARNAPGAGGTRVGAVRDRNAELVLSASLGMPGE